MSDREDKAYIAFLEDSIVEDAEVIDVPTIYSGPQSPIKAWDGNSQLPTITKDEDLDNIVNKILKKKPEDQGQADPDRDEVNEGPLTEANLMRREKAKTEGKNARDADEDCPACDKKIQEIYRELGISPLALLEDEDLADDEDDEDDDDELEDSSEDKDDDEEDGDEDAAEPMEESFSPHETKVLETLIREMGLSEEDEEENEFADDAEDSEDDEDSEDEDDVDFGDDEDSEE